MSPSTRLERLFLYHLWACVPFALVWMVWPGVVGVSQNPLEIQALRLVIGAAALYLVVRSVLTFRPWGTLPWEYVWPLAEVLLISLALFFKAEPADSWLVLLYLFPVTQAAATLNLRWALGIGFLAAGAYLTASGLSGLESLHYAYAAFRLFFLVLMASLCTHLGREVARGQRELALAEYKNALAAEMHDGLQQYLGAIAMRLELARTLIPTDPAEAAQMAVEQRHLARQAADELRVMVRRLRSPLLEKEGLAEALRQYLALLGERTSFATELLITGKEIRLPPRTEQVLLRIVQEALNNVMKHAQATRVGVTVEFAPPEVRCTVQDNGRGFDPAQLPTEPGLAGGFGMETMHGRAAELKGTCRVNSEPGEGVTVVVTVPYSPEQRRE